MNEQRPSGPDDTRSWLTALGPDEYALARVDADTAPPDGDQAPAPGTTGITRPGADLNRVTVLEVAHDRAQTLHRWLQLDDGERQLAVISCDLGILREHTPGELAAQLARDSAAPAGQLAPELASWLYRRYAQAAQGLELGWIAAAAAWTCHMRAASGIPLESVLALALEAADEHNETTAELVRSTGQRMTTLVDRLERPGRPREELAEDWHLVNSLTDDVPALAELADWLLDQIALRDANAQRLRAVLEPDITDYLHDRRAARLSEEPSPELDAPRAAQLAQAREAVRVYTVAAHSGRDQQAQQLLNAFPVPVRPLTDSAPATVWRRNVATAREAFQDLDMRRAHVTAETGSDHAADPELVHAELAYLDARDSHLHRLYDALGRLAFPVPVPGDLPAELAAAAAAQTERRVSEAFGTADRAAQVLDGQISYRQQPVPARRRATTEADLLNAARTALRRIALAGATLDADDIRARLEGAMARLAAPAGHRPPASAQHEHGHAQALPSEGRAPGLR
ncbi:hypothetical protein [Streptomyces sp. NBC_00470]|uniref:hypothetical protein n=1 Tax=Streptomyces sp. NBC_00470 TaxID=2975753 RepID=UPI002F91B5F3